MLQEGVLKRPIDIFDMFWHLLLVIVLISEL